MNEQLFFLLFLTLAFAVTILLYIWEAKKAMEYQNDERWKQILLKAKTIADLSNWVLLIALAIISTVIIFYDSSVLFSLTRLAIIGELYIGLHNLLELIGILYYDRIL